MKRLLSTIVMSALLMVVGGACVEDRAPIFPDNNINGGNDDEGKDDGEDDGNEEPVPPSNEDYPDTSWAAGELDWVFDMSAVPEIRVEVTEEQWNELLKEYDRNSNTAAYIHCNTEFKSKGENHTFVDAENEQEFDEFVSTCKRLAFFDTGITPVYGDKLICLSTCEYTLDNGRLVVAAVRIT